MNADITMEVKFFGGELDKQERTVKWPFPDEFFHAGKNGFWQLYKLNRTYPHGYFSGHANYKYIFSGETKGKVK